MLPEHEFLNLDRIVELLKRGIPKVKDKLLTGAPTKEVHDAFKKAIERHKIEEEKLSKAINNSGTEEEKLSNKKLFGDIEKSRKRLGKIEAKFLSRHVKAQDIVIPINFLIFLVNYKTMRDE